MWDNYFEGEFYRTGKVPAVVTEDGMIVLGRDDARVKSRSNVEYDDDGNVIPLSERFNSEKDDIRYSKVLDKEADAFTYDALIAKPDMRIASLEIPDSYRSA